MFVVSVSVLENNFLLTYQDNLLSLIDCIEYIQKLNNSDNIKILNVKIERLEEF